MRLTPLREVVHQLTPISRALPSLQRVPLHSCDPETLALRLQAHKSVGHGLSSRSSFSLWLFVGHRAVEFLVERRFAILHQKAAIRLSLCLRCVRFPVRQTVGSERLRLLPLSLAASTARLRALEVMLGRLDPRLQILDEAISRLQGNLGRIRDDEIVDIVVVYDVGDVVCRLLCRSTHFLFCRPIFRGFVHQIIVPGDLLLIAWFAVRRLLLWLADFGVLLKIAHFQGLNHLLFWFFDLLYFLDFTFSHVVHDFLVVFVK